MAIVKSIILYHAMAFLSLNLDQTSRFVNAHISKLHFPTIFVNDLRQVLRFKCTDFRQNDVNKIAVLSVLSRRTGRSAVTESQTDCTSEFRPSIQSSQTFELKTTPFLSIES